MRRSARKRAAVSYREGDDDVDSPDDDTDARAGPEYTQDPSAQDEGDDDDNDDNEGSSDDDEDEGDQTRPAAAAARSPKGTKAKSAAVPKIRKLKTALVGMKGLVEYATSDQAGCKICGEKIDFGALRIGKFKRAAKFDGFIPLWYHSHCFINRWWHTIAFVEQLGGHDRLRWSDIVALDKEIGGPPRTLEEEQHWTLLQHEVNTLWAWHDMLQENGLETRELRQVLESNKQPVFGKQDALRLRVAEIWIHGALPQCPQCSNGVLYFYPNQGLFRCMSYSSAWSKCTFQADSVTRVPLTISSDLIEKYPFLAATPPALVPLAPRRSVPRKEKKPRVPKAPGEESKKKGGKKASSKKESKGEEPSAFVRGVVHPSAELENAQVVADSNGEFLSVALSNADITTGTNSYYILQVLQVNNTKRPGYALFCKWGRTGTFIGSKKLQDFKDLQDAIKEFESNFEERTGNSWKQRFNFEKKPGRLVPLDLETSHNPSPQPLSTPSQLSFSAAPLPPLHPRVENLLAALFSTEMITASLEALDFDVKKVPIGKISKKQVQMAYQILRELSDAIQQPSETSQQLILDLTNRFYTVIPHSFGFRRPPIINNVELLRSKFNLLDALLNAAIAASIDQLGSSMQVRYRSLYAEITPVDNEQPLFRLISAYVAASNHEDMPIGRMKVEEIFHVRRKGEVERFAQHSSTIPNHKLLWHGSRTSNFVGILSQGLRIAPPEAPPSGYVFGKGIYFADVAAKSATFCGVTPQYSTGYLLLAQVALGAAAPLCAPQYMEKPLPGTHSTWAQGKRAPMDGGDVEISQDEPSLSTCLHYKIPLGEVGPTFISDAKLDYSEYVVYDIAQVCLRFLVKVSFQISSC